MAPAGGLGRIKSFRPGESKPRCLSGSSRGPAVIESRQRKLHAPELLRDVYQGRRFVEGKPIKRSTERSGVAVSMQVLGREFSRRFVGRCVRNGDLVAAPKCLLASCKTERSGTTDKEQSHSGRAYRDVSAIESLATAVRASR